MQMERRTVPGEAPGSGGREVEALLARLRSADAEFRAASRVLFARSPYELPAEHPLPQALQSALRTLAPAHPGTSAPARPRTIAPCIGMSFWTDAAVLGEAGIPSVLFGPVGAGLHSLEEWVDVQSVFTCRDALVHLARDWCR